MAELPHDFYLQSALDVARGLLGQNLCRESGGEIIRAKIIEVEAYIGPEDKACHAHRGKTKRNQIMFNKGGHWYVYLCYGIHWLLNVTTGPAGFPAAVLIRAVEGHIGPGRLTKNLGIDKAQHEKPISRTTGLWIEESGFKVPDTQIKRTPRIGIDYAQEWKDAPLRLVWSPGQGDKN